MGYLLSFFTKKSRITRKSKPNKVIIKDFDSHFKILIDTGFIDNERYLNVKDYFVNHHQNQIVSY
jgi:hypothetical protein